MSLYARIQNTIVVETVTLATGVSLSDCFVPQLAEQYVDITYVNPTPQVGWAYTGSTFGEVPPPAAPAAPPPLTLAQTALGMIASGLTIVSTSAPAINGLYSTNAAAQNNILAIQVYIQSNGKFPGSSGSLLWLDQNNSPHTFTTTGQFTEFASAIADYVSDLTLVAMTGSGALPPDSTPIA